MRKTPMLLAILLVFLSTKGVTAQENKVFKFTYLFTFQSDTNDVNSKRLETYYLTIYKDHSTYFSQKKLDSEEFMRKTFEARGFDPTSPNFHRTGGIGTGEVIYKFPDGKVSYQRTMAGTPYSYEENPDWNWEISDSTVEYSGYQCQLAKVNYGGRDWAAWFATDIPVSDGPYKFMGLPGLIVKMTESRNECLYELTKVETIAESEDEVPSTEVVSKQKFQEIFKKYQYGGGSPMSSIPPNIAARAKIFDENGNEVTAEDMQIGTKQMMEARRRNNNTIERDQ